MIVAKITFSQVAKRTGGKSLIDLEIPDRKLVVFTGPAGSGKSTLLRMIAGLTKISSGEIILDDKRINDLSPHRRDVAMIFPNDSLYPGMTIRENIAFGLKRRRFGKTEIRKRVEDAGNALGIGAHLEKKPKECGLAIRQRAAIARGIARQPQVLLYDHALLSLTAEVRAELRDEIVRLHERLQTTTIFATADNAEAMSMAEAIVLFDEDGLQAVGTPRELYEQPGNMVVAKFFGYPPMNFVRGELKLNRGALQFAEAEDGTIQVNLSTLERFEGAQSFVGKSVFLGVRPEDIEIASVAESKEGKSIAKFRAIAERVEPFGPQTDVYFSTGPHTGACRSRALLDRSEAGRRIEFVINLEKVCFFSQSDEKRIV